MGEAVGGHGLPVGDIDEDELLFPLVEDELFPFEAEAPDSVLEVELPFPVVAGASGFDELVFGVAPFSSGAGGAEFPALGDAVLGEPGVPGSVPHGEPDGLVPGVFVALGFTVEGCLVVPGAGGLGEFEPGTPGGFAGVAVPAGGVAVPACGVAVLAGGVAVPGLCGCVLELPAGGAPPAGLLWAITQDPQEKIIARNAIFLADINPPGPVCRCAPCAGNTHCKSSISNRPFIVQIPLT